MNWNIWDIKNRWLRTAVAWPLAIVCGLAFVVAVPVVLIGYAANGAYEGFREFARIITGPEWRDIGRFVWLALTAREAV